MAAAEVVEIEGRMAVGGMAVVGAVGREEGVETTMVVVVVAVAGREDMARARGREESLNKEGC